MVGDPGPPTIELGKERRNAMTFTVFPDGAKAAIEFDWNGVGCSITLHFEKDTPTSTDFTNLAAEVAAGFADDMLTELTEELIMGDVVVYDLSEEGAPKYVNSDESGSPGVKVADALPNNTAVVISHRTEDTGRSARGRTYLPGVSEAEESNGILLDTPRDDFLTAWGTFIAGIEALGWAFVIAQRYLDGVQLVTGVMRPVVTEIIKLQLGTQRRRQVPSAI